MFKDRKVILIIFSILFFIVTDAFAWNFSSNKNNIVEETKKIVNK